MSAVISTPVTSIFAQPSDNHFELRDRENKTRVTLNLEKPGPLTQGESAEGPSLQYQGVEGTFSFTGEQIVTQITAIGQMFAVILNIVPDLRTLSFTLLLPSVVHKANSPAQAFETIAIKSERHTSLQGIPTTTGANPTYAVLKMSGTASKVEVPDNA